MLTYKLLGGLEPPRRKSPAGAKSTFLVSVDGVSRLVPAKDPIDPKLTEGKPGKEEPEEAVGSAGILPHILMLTYPFSSPTMDEVRTGDDPTGGWK